MIEPLRARETPQDVDAIHALGREIARAFILALRSLRSHGAENQISRGAVQALTRAFNEGILLCGWIELRVVEDFVFLGEQRLRLPRSDAQMIGTLVQELAHRGIGSISLSSAVTEAQVFAFLESLNRRREGGAECFHRLFADFRQAHSPILIAPPEGLGTPEECAAGLHTAPAHPPAAPAATGATAGAASGAASVAGADSTTPGKSRPSTLRIVSDDDADEAGASLSAPLSLRERCRRAFYTALAVHQAYFKSVQEREPLPYRHSKRSVQTLVDLALEDDGALLGLTTLKTQDNYSFFHSVNVCILSVGLGKKLGLTRDQLVELGMAGLLHDLGKAGVPVDILRKPGALTPEERRQIEFHPQFGTYELLRFGGFNTQLLPQIIGCFEHHMNADGSEGGYPRLTTPYRPHLYGRIVSISDVYDALTTKRKYRKTQMRREEVLAYLLSQARVRFDPALLLLFVHLVGVYPVGSVVRLASGRRGVVVAIPDDSVRCHRPVIRLCDSAGGTPVAEVVDLSAMAAEGAPQDTIVEVLDPETSGIDLKQIFL